MVFVLKQVVFQLLLVNIQLTDLTLLLGNFMDLLLKLFVRLFKEHLFTRQVLLGLLLETDHLLLVIALLLLKLLDVLVSFLHLILAILDFLL